jgi:RHS repeat-associated protein
MRVIQERNSANTPAVAYTRGADLSGSLEGAGGIGGLLARSSGYSGGNWTSHAYYHADGNGNITCLMNSSQSVVASYRYDPYGNTISKTGSLADANVYRFSSKEIVSHTNSVLYYYGYRFYEPGFHRWLSRDPIDEIGFENLPQPRNSMILLGEGRSDNLFAFVGNDPTRNVDVYGLQAANGSSPTPSLPITLPPFPGGPASVSCPGYLGGRNVGNFPDFHGSSPPRPCSPIGASTRAKANGKTVTKDCPCIGKVSVKCYTWDTCDLWSFGTGDVPKGSWTSHEECPCPEYSTF